MYFNTTIEEYKVIRKHLATSQKMALAVFSLFFCMEILKRNINHFFFLMFEFPSLKVFLIFSL